MLNFIHTSQLIHLHIVLFALTIISRNQVSTSIACSLLQSRLTMPTLKQLSCQIEWAGSNVPFKEYGTVYGDGYVECYIAIPNSSTPFSINLRSDGYIAAGLAMFVLMDGVYQCNRNRDDLRQMGKSSDATTKFRDVNFRVRQREERLPNGGWVGRPWRFAPFQLGMPMEK